jgi:thiamine kinase-like enzyme
MNFSFSPAFSPQWLKENLSQYLWRENEPPGDVVQLEILYAGMSLGRPTGLYQVELKGRDGHVRRQMYVGYVVPGNLASDEYKAVLNSATIEPPVGRAVAFVPEANLILSAYPNDRKMRLLSEADLKIWLAGHLGEISNGVLEDWRWQVGETKVEMLRYVPNKRFTARCRAKIQAENGLEKEILFIAKQLSDAKKAKNLYRHLLLLRQAWSDHPVVFLPQALAVDEKNAIVFIEDMPGKNLKHALAEINWTQVMPAVGGLLANFHRAQIRVRKAVSIESELREVRDAMRAMVNAFPPFQPRLKEFYEKFQSWQPGDKAPEVLLHGTYRLNHIFIHEGRLALLDLDSLRMGHPAYDVANFLSSLYYWEAQESVSLPQRRRIARHFLEGYAAKAASAISSAAALWFLASLLINKQAKKYVAHFHEDREEKLRRMLAAAELALAKCRQASNDLTLAALWKALP